MFPYPLKCVIIKYKSLIHPLFFFAIKKLTSLHKFILKKSSSFGRNKDTTLRLKLELKSPLRLNLTISKSGCFSKDVMLILESKDSFSCKLQIFGHTH